MNPPPSEDARDSILRQFRMKESLLDQGRREGRAEAAAEFRRELDDLKRKVAALWDAFCKEPTQRIARLDEGHG